MKRRPGRIRLWLGSLCNGLSWWLLDPHDSWMIEWRDEKGVRFGGIRVGRYSMARAAARELKGKVIGCCAQSIPADGEDEVRVYA